jgi:hypothetical protein
MSILLALREKLLVTQALWCHDQEIQEQYFRNEQWRCGLNGRAVKTQEIANEVAERTGLEPATPGVTGRYSDQLNYRSAVGSRAFYSNSP